MRVQRRHVLAATVAVAAAAVVAVGTGLGFADTAPERASVCSGSVTFSAEGGAPAATSDRFPVGTRLRVTNLDNGRAVTVTVTGPSGSADIPCRVGGDEFAVIVPEVEVGQARQLVGRIQRAVSAQPIARAGRVRVSAGVSDLQPNDNPTSLFERGDESLYAAKHTAHNGGLAAAE